MKMPGLIIIIVFVLLWTACFDLTTKGTFTVADRVYSPDSSRYLLKYEYVQGAWDGGRTWMATILRKGDSADPKNIQFSYSNLDFDDLYWKTNDTMILEERFTEFVANGRSQLRDTVLNGVTIHVIQRDPIDTSYRRKIFYRETSPDGKHELYVYKYVKPVNGNYFLNVSIVNAGDSLPKFGNFFVTRYDFDCLNDIRWDSASILDIKASSSCYFAFAEYLVKNRPDIPYHVAINDTTPGNIPQYMQ